MTFSFKVNYCRRNWIFLFIYFFYNCRTRNVIKGKWHRGISFFFIFLHRFLIKAWGIMMPSEVSTDYHFSLTFWIHVEINKMENGKKNSDLILKHVCTTKKLSACDLSSYHHTDIIIQSRVYWMTLIWKWNELWS